MIALLALAESGRVRLRHPEPYDIEAMACWDDVSQTEMEAFVVSYNPDIASDGQLRIIVADRTTDRPIGCIDLFDYDPKKQRASIGYFIDPELRRQGLGAEAMRLFLKKVAPEIPLAHIDGKIADNNMPSRLLARSLGFRPTDADDEEPGATLYELIV